MMDGIFLSQVLEAMSRNTLLEKLQSPMFDALSGAKNNTDKEELER
jgi:hypothetical protein